MFLLSHFMTSWKTWMFINYPVLFLVSKNSCMSLKCTSCKTTFANFDTFFNDERDVVQLDSDLYICWLVSRC